GRFPSVPNDLHSRISSPQEPTQCGASTFLTCTLIVFKLLLTACGGNGATSSHEPTIARTATPTLTPLFPGYFTYHGRRVQLSPSAYLIFWGQDWQSDPNLHAAMIALESYFTMWSNRDNKCI